MKNIHTENFHIKSYESGFDGKLKLFALFNYLQEVAGNHANELGFGFDDLYRNGWFWVLARLKIQILEIPAWNETISVTTWHKGIDRLFGLRDFIVADAKNKTLMQATSAWAIIDLKNHRPQRIPDILKVDPEANYGHAINEKLEKIPVFENVFHSAEHIVEMSELDVNNHVNNGKYVEWIMNGYDMEFIQSHQFKSIQINYAEEAYYKNQIIFNYSRSEQNSLHHTVEGKKQNSTNTIFQAIMDWKSS